VCFWVSDGSIPMLRARYNFLHFQVPFKDVNGRTLFNKMKLYRINNVICNSFFTKGFIDEEFGVKSDVIYPPVDVEKFKSKRKKNVIISIGRFSQLTQAKRQDVLVDAYKKLVDSGKIPSDWKLILAGGTEVGAGEFVSELKKLISGYPIKIVESPDFSKIVDLCGSAKIFWSASGYGIKEKKEPSKVEHFGISVVEAMSAGCVPLVYSAGGHKEIIENGANGYLWEKKTQLIERTKQIIRDDVRLRGLSREAKEVSKIYEYAKFEAQVCSLLG